MTKRKSGIKTMKMVAIKNECYAISGTSNLTELKQKYYTLCKGRDFRKRKIWEYVLERLQKDGDWMGIRVTEIERAALEEQLSHRSSIPNLVNFSAERVEWDKAADNDD